MNNPKAARDIIENSEAIYGYSPNPKSTRIGKYADLIDWTDQKQVAVAKQKREEYHLENESKLQNLYGAGCSIEEIATIMNEERNENGMTLQQALEKYGSYEEVINASIRSNPGMDACTGLYDIYHGGN